MASAAQVTANRLNAQHSTGPRTLEGKQHSSQNARKSGYCSIRLVIAPERQADFDAYSAQLYAEVAPEGILEHEYFKRLLAHGWNLDRVREDETGVAEAERNEANSHQLLLLGRYRRDLERSFDRAMRSLRALQTDRMQRARQIPQDAVTLRDRFPVASPFILPDPSKLASKIGQARTLVDVFGYRVPPELTRLHPARPAAGAGQPVNRTNPIGL